LKQELQCNQKPFNFLNTNLPTANVGESYSATLYVENNVTDISITCNRDSDMGIDFSDPDFSGNPTTSGSNKWECTASENSPGTRSVTKQYVITINPAAGGGFPTP